jgi:hypothetical protein
VAVVKSYYYVWYLRGIRKRKKREKRIREELLSFFFFFSIYTTYSWWGYKHIYIPPTQPHLVVDEKVGGAHRFTKGIIEPS